MNTIIMVTLSLCLLAVGCAGSSGRKLVKSDVDQKETNKASNETEKSNGHSFAYRICLAGCIDKRGLYDIPKEQYIREIELKNVADKTYRYSEKTSKPASTDFLQLVGAAGSIAMAPGLGAATNVSNIARSAGSFVLAGAGSQSSRQLTNWQKKLGLARIIVWMPEAEANTPEEANTKLKQLLEQAVQGIPLGESAIVAIPQPILEDPPAVIIDTLQYSGKVWTWNKERGIRISPSKTEPKQYKIIAAYDDVSNWKKISERLPRWCFVYLGTLASNGQYFLGYPQVLWKGQPYYFGE